MVFPLLRKSWSRWTSAGPATEWSRQGSVDESVGGDAHGAGGALDDLHRGVDVVGVQVGQLGGGDLAHLVLGQLADLVLLRDTRALRDAGGLLDQLGGGRGLRDEREGPVLVDGDLDRD